MWMPDAAAVAEPKIDFDKIIKNVEELNVIAGEGVAAIQNVQGGARLRVPDPVPLQLFRNGIVMFAGPFRPYTDETTQACIRDLTEGYFPWELKDRYPDGVPLKLVDRRNEDYKSPQQLFSGQGYQLASVSGDAQRDAFLRRLPASVVRNGKVVDIRAGVQEAIEGPKAKVAYTVVQTAVVAELAARADGDVRSDTPTDIATLQIKSHTGAETLVVKLRFTDRVADVYTHVQQHFSGIAFVLSTTYPKKLLEDRAASLVEAGLTPNAVLRMVLRK